MVCIKCFYVVSLVGISPFSRKAPYGDGGGIIHNYFDPFSKDL